LAGSKLRELIYSQLGYDPTGKLADRFKNWHDRIAINYQSAPKGFFHVFNEAHTIIYELIQAGARIGEKFVVDISIGQHWSKYWAENSLDGAPTRTAIPTRILRQNLIHKNHGATRWRRWARSGHGFRTPTSKAENLVLISKVRFRVGRFHHRWPNLLYQL
jgi:hypothetical protein